MAESKRTYDVPKQVRVCGEEFDAANEIFKKSGFTFSDVVRMVISKTIQEGRIPLALSCRENEKMLDDGMQVDRYMDDILAMVGVSDNDVPAIEKMFSRIFGPSDASDMNAAQLREWGARTGLPDTLSVGTLADLFDHGPFAKDPWSGGCDADIKQTGTEENMMILMQDMANIRWNLENTKNEMVARASKFLMEFDNPKDDEKTEEDV